MQGIIEARTACSHRRSNLRHIYGIARHTTARLSELRDLTAMVEAFGDGNQLPAPKIFAINLALDELITNVVSHGTSEDSSDLTIGVHLRIAGDILALTIEDNAQPFDPTLAAKPDVTSALEARRVGGLGLHLIKSFADRVSHEFVDGKNRLTLEHDLKPTSEHDRESLPDRVMDGTMSIEVVEERDSGVLALVPVDRLDSTNARTFESIVTAHIGNGEQRMIIDFRRLYFISSSGLRVFLIAAKKFGASQGKLVLCGMQDHIHEVFRVTGFDQIIPIRDSRQSAMAMF